MLVGCARTEKCMRRVSSVWHFHGPLETAHVAYVRLSTSPCDLGVSVCGLTALSFVLKIRVVLCKDGHRTFTLII